jgi:DNA-binding transcriptional LysR family regulator
MADFDWDHYRHALAIGSAGSLAGAARLLGVNHTTVLRRLDALEAHLGSRLFERQRSGYQPTEAGLALLEQARHMAARADEIERQVLGRDRELTGVLRVTTAFVVMDHLLPEPLADFARAYPGIEVEVVENAFLVDLASRHTDADQGWTRREADVALRLSGQVAEHLVGRQLGLTQCRVYALRGVPDLPQLVADAERSTEIAQLDAQATAARRYAEAVAAGGKPQLSWNIGGSAAAGTGSGSTGPTKSGTYSVGLSVNIPLLSPGLAPASDAARKRAEAARLQRAEALESRRFRVAEVHEQALSALDRAQRVAEVLKNSEQVRSFTLQQWQQLGRRSLFDVMAAEADHYAMRVAYVNALHDVQQLNANLLSLGRGVIDWLR